MKRALKWTLLAIVLSTFWWSCGPERDRDGHVHEALSERHSLPKTIFDDPYSTNTQHETGVQHETETPHERASARTREAAHVDREPIPSVQTVTETPLRTANASRKSGRHLSSSLSDDTTDGSSGGQTEVCSSIEYPGQGPSSARSTVASWEKTTTVFNSVKSDLLSWLSKHKAKFGDKTYATLQTLVRSTRLEKASPLLEPDLSWRGIGVLSKNSSGTPVLRLGGGFTRLIEKEPTRARFELTRLVAQAWAPCELMHMGAGEPWSGYLRCMGLTEAAEGCGPGGYSEAGWAVSSALATQLTDAKKLGCQVPAFADPKYSECPKNFLLPLVLTPDGAVSQRETR